MTDLTTLMTSVKDLRAARRELVTEARVASMRAVMRAQLASSILRALGLWRQNVAATIATEDAAVEIETQRRSNHQLTAEAAELRLDCASLAEESARLASELNTASADAAGAAQKVRRLEADLEDMLTAQRERLKSEAALQARLNEASRAEGVLQSRLEESLAGESRLQARLGLAQEAAQSQQNALDALAASEGELRSQLESMREAQRNGTAAMGQEQLWRTNCQVLRRTLHEVEAEASTSLAGESALARAAEMHAARSAEAAQTEASNQVRDAMRRLGGARLLSLFRMHSGGGYAWAIHEWRAAVLAISIDSTSKAEAARMRKASLSLKRNLKDSEAGHADYEDRLQRLTAEVERTRRESAQTLNKFSSDKQKIEMKLRRADHETAVARKAEAEAARRLQKKVLEAAVLGRPTLLRARRLAGSLQRWRRAMQALRRVGHHASHDHATRAAPGGSGQRPHQPTHHQYQSSSNRRSPAAPTPYSAHQQQEASPPHVAKRDSPTPAALSSRAHRPRVPTASPLPSSPEKLPASVKSPPATQAIGAVAPSHAPRVASVTAATEKAAAAAEAARSVERVAMAREAAAREAEGARAAAREAPVEGADRGVDGLAAKWLQGAAEVATRWLKPTADTVDASAKRSWSRSAEAMPSPRRRDDSSATDGRRPSAAGGAPMEEVARYGSPHMARPNKHAEGKERAPSSASKRAKEVAPQAPSASEVAQLRKMILSSFGKDGVPRLDSVSLYSLGKLLGRGAFGAVKMGVHKLTGSVVAIKNFKKADVKSEVESRAIDREIRILKQSIHQHIIKLYEVIDSPTNYYLVMECAAHGDLAGHLEKKGRLKEPEAAKYLVQTISAIAHCHARGVIHRDIKPENLLLDAHYDIKVTDFGLSAIIKPGQLLKVACGTPSYSAPEVINRKEYDGTLTDVWSLGVLLYHMTHGRLPFNDLQHIRAGDYAVSNELIPPAALDLLRSMLVVSPDHRASLKRVSEHPWVVQWRPHALREPKRRFGLTHHDVDAELVRKIDEKFGLRSEHVEVSLKDGLYNHATATYSMLEEMC